MSLDEPRPVRPGEELPLPALASWLELQGFTGHLEVLQFPKGHSNLTYLVRVGERELVLRRPPVGSKVKSAHDMGREFRVLSRLAPVWELAPKPLAHCDDPAVLGAPFYVMERIRGIVLRGPAPRERLSEAEVRKLCGEIIDRLAELHTLDWREAGLGDLGKPEGYVRRQVEGWTKRWQDAKTEELPEVEGIARWLAERIPAETGASLIHNDWKHDNLVLDERDPTRIRGVLDWEMSTVGDPLMDLGTALAYWIEQGDADELKAFAFGPTFLPGSFSRRELVGRYGERTGRNVSGILFYFCFALFKTAVVLQQIYKRYVQGFTKDERFAAMILGVHLLSRMAVRAAEKGDISPG